METIQIVYGLRIEGIQFKEIDFSDTTPEFKNIILRPTDADNYKYELLLRKNISSHATQQLKAIFNEASNEAETFKYIFSVAADVKIFEFECLGYYHNNTLIKYSGILGSGTRSSGEFIYSHTAGEPSVKKIKDKMQTKIDLSAIQMFYDAATIIEPVSRFISLYALLLHKFEDNQKNVDEAILKVDETVAQFKSPHNKGYETVFSKLRNEMSHKREGINILETQNEIRLNLSRFEKIVKKLTIGEP